MTVLAEMGLSAAEQEELLQTLTGSHSYDLHVELRDRDESVIDIITGYVTAGQVDIDVTKGWNAPDSTGRTLTMNLFDPTRNVNVTQRNLLNRAIAVDQMVQLPSRLPGDKVAIPQGRFDIVKADIEGPWVKLSCVDKRARCRSNLVNVRTLPKGMRVTDAIYEVLHVWSGIPDAQIALPGGIMHRLPRQFQAHFGLTKWQIAVQLAASVANLLYPSAGGKFVMREIPTDVDFAFTQGSICGQSPSDPGFITMSQSLTDELGRPVPNTVIVQGFKVAQGIPPLQRIVYADPDSPISKENLAVGGVDYISATTVSHPTVKDPARLIAIGKAYLAQAETIVSEGSWNALLLPIFEEWDCISGDDGFTQVTTNLRKLSMGLTTDDSTSMSVGYLRRLSFSGARPR